ncbi:WS/DGAT/MGAT family O-acyltransferase [Pseudaquabacterium pictum]|uniref:diacylglycerol O-acyltransferase n=1 Tax=Pseudaquabacterium pictum TaxID=2315236 RepID=A0A480AYZ8_9BURK|nr:wax ester/triacylglycerol synthase family O-acyltransferase [Rubrivivax pictus]GCL64038.1 diacylglycerol O-acyltransferase [Rubrivivax pictus]
MSDMSHLSIIDGAFLHLESPEMPMHVGSLALFDPPEGGATDWYEAVKAHVAGRMHLAPVFTRKLALMPFDLANPVWIPDDDIDLDYHVRYLVLPKPGTMAQMEALCARLHSSLLDRSRPLWEFYVIEGLADGRLGFYSKVHHAAVDGQAAVAMANSVFDLTPEPRRVKPPRARRGHRYQLGVAELLGAALSNQARQVVEFAKLLPPLLGAASGAAVDAARQALAQRRAGGAATAGPKLKMAPPTPFNMPITNQRAFAGVALPLGEVKAIGKGLGGSINDMVMWLCSTALRDYLAEGRELPPKTLVAGVPISLRAEGDTSANNQVSGTVIDLATQEKDPAKRLAQIMAGTQAMKATMGSFGNLIPTDFPSLGSPWLLSGLASLYGRSRLASRLRVANLTISNVPGPQVPLYLAGATMTGMFPLSIVVHGVALNITVQSYRGQLCFGLIACRRAVPDVGELAQALDRAMGALRKLAGAQAAAAPAAAPEPVPEPAPRKRARPKLAVVEAAAAPAEAARPRTARRRAA